MALSLGSVTDSLFRGLRLRALLKKAPLIVAFWLLTHGGEALAQDIVPNLFSDGAAGVPVVGTTLRDAIIWANNNPAGNDRVRLNPGNYVLSNYNAAADVRNENDALLGDLDIRRRPAPTDGTLTIEGLGTSPDQTIIDAAGIDRVFHIVNGGTVTFRNLTIRGGFATDTGNVSLAANDAAGGGVLANGGVVRFENVVIANNEARAANGEGTTGGGNAMGGGIAAWGGSVTLDGCTVGGAAGAGNKATGGAGGNGGEGPTGNGGDGGNGGWAAGGGVYSYYARLSLTGATVANNQNLGGVGGSGGTGGTGSPSPSSGAGWGGSGGAGGLAQGGGIYQDQVALALSGTTVTGNLNAGGNGGAGGVGADALRRGLAGSGGNSEGAGLWAGTAGYGGAVSGVLVTRNSGRGGAGGVGRSGGNGGYALGGGMHVAGGVNDDLTITDSEFSSNTNIGGPGAASLYNGGGTGGDAAGGGVFMYNDYGGLVTFSGLCRLSSNTNQGGAGGNGGIRTAPASASSPGAGWGGSTIGGGLYVATANMLLQLSGDGLTVASNTNTGGAGGVGDAGAPSSPGGAGGGGGGASGGGIYTDLVDAQLTNAIVSDNTCAGGAGGTGGARGAGFFVSGGSAGQGGSAQAGGIRFGGYFSGYGGSFALNSSSVSGNKATGGNGGLGGAGGNGTGPVGSNGWGGTADGAGIYAFGGGGGASLTIHNSAITSNAAAGGAGGAGGGTSQGPGGDSMGGGLYAYQVALDIRNSTISSNSAAGGAGVGVKGGDIRGIGGGLYVGAPLAVHNSTIVRNSARGGNPSLGAQNGGGVYYRWYDGGTNELPSNIINSIVAENKAVASDGATQAADDFDGDVDGASADNIFGSNLGLDGATNGTNGNQIGTAAVPLDPKLGPLGDNGGPTQTHTLLAGSPALDAGSNPDNQTWDQRGDGFPRVQGTRCDVGATEAQPPTLNAGGPYTIAEGDPLDLDGSQSTSPDGRTLTFSWDVNGDGTFGDAAGATPTLTWPQLQALGIDDGPKTFAMAVQISDGIYTTAGTVTLTLNNAPPTPTIVGLPPVATVGVPINLTSSVTDPSAADTAAGFTYAWTVTKDGNPFASGTTAEFSFTPDGAGAYVVTLTATDKDGGKGTDTKSLAGNNPPVVSPPVITPTDPVVGEPVTVIVSPSDPDGDPLTITYDYGDGSSDTTGTHVYTTPGTYTITVTVSDGGSTVTTQITITVGYNLIVTKLKGHALYGRSGKDWAHVTAILPGLPAGFDPTGKTLTVDVGGATATFVLSKTGKANTKDGMARVQLSYAKRPNAKGRAFAGGPVRLWVHLRGTWSDDWVDDGIDMAQHVRKKPIVMPVKVKLDDKTYGGTPNALLTTAEHMYASFLFHQRR